MDVNVRIAGEAGQGIVTAGNALAGTLAGMGLYVFGTRNYESRIRGGLNWFDIRAADRELNSRRETPDILVAMTDEATEELGPGVSAEGVILAESGEDSRVLEVDMEGEAKDVTGQKVMANAIALGACFGLLGYDIDELCGYLDEQFAHSGEEVVAQNEKCVRRGAELVENWSATIDAPEPADAPPTIYEGGKATGLGAAVSGVKLATGYPMTPGTAVLSYLAQHGDDYGIVVEQAEDELAAVNMVCGATYAGVPAVTSTSGGGFALMCEGLSLSGMMELPIFIVLAQRPGPATGLPTRTGQQDLQFVLRGGHGEFPRLVLAPGNQRQSYELMQRGLEMAHKYQSPAVLLTDQFLIDCQKNIPELDESVQPIDRHIEEDPSEDYVRYEVTDDGVSPRTVPGYGSYVICDSDEHNEEGHITEDFDVRMAQQDKRMRKQEGLTEEMVEPERYGPDEADHVLVCWGSTYMPCREAVDMLADRGASVAMVHFPQVWPLDVELARQTLGVGGPTKTGYTCVEGNATGQFAGLLKENDVLPDCELMLRYDGRPFTAEEIVERI